MAGDHGFDCQIKGCPAELPSNSRNNGVSSLIHTSLEQPHGFFGQPLSQSCKHWPWLTYWQHYKTLEFGLLYCQTIARSNFRHQKPGESDQVQALGHLRSCRQNHLLWQSAAVRGISRHILEPFTVDLSRTSLMSNPFPLILNAPGVN